jgi:hypothetical protein
VHLRLEEYSLQYLLCLATQLLSSDRTRGQVEVCKVVGEDGTRDAMKKRRQKREGSRVFDLRPRDDGRRQQREEVDSSTSSKQRRGTTVTCERAMLSRGSILLASTRKKNGMLSFCPS